MEYQVSARKFRPGTFDELIGQPHVVQTLRNAILRKQVAHAYLFSGMRGVGKTTVARILAKALNCENGPTTDPCGQCESCKEVTRGNSVDVIEIDGASNTGVDDVRELRENVKYSPFRGTYRIYIIDEVHMLSNSAFNALLKTLEEPPAHAVFVFATTEVHKIPATITSRCQHFNFRRIPRREIIARLLEVAQRNGVNIEERSLGAIAQASEGSMRDALSLLDQAVAFGGKSITDQDIEEMLGSVPDELVRRLVETVVSQDAAAAVELVGEVIDHGYDLRAYCGAVVERMRNLMIAAVVPEAGQAEGLMDLPSEDVQQLMTEAKAFSVEQLQELFQLFAQAEDRLRATAHPRFAFEVATVRAARLRQRPQAETNSPAKDTRPKPQVKNTEAPQAATPRQPVPESATKQKTSPPPERQTTSGSTPARNEPRPIPRPPIPSNRPPQATVPPSAPERPPAVSTTSPTKAAPPRGRPSPALAPAIRQEDWHKVVEAMVKKYPNIGTFLEMGMLVKVEGHQVIIGFPKTASVACSRIQKEETRTLVSTVCQEVVGATVQLRVVELTEGHESGPSIKQIRAQQQKQDEDALLQEAKANPLVKQTMELFGGAVIKASRMVEKVENKEA
ncbi:DNA polymerase III subunit gamma/tau [Candidatus Nitronereus thalassa]|uniref:DNA polymerase III subunit gamma/tau n=1 Tax=Candidatus Nitronereus thalassa TaxID=3020898 RepID=A0ABU3K895_9BACT|nr:DNA polymerase III subunit gamma/tau [Candidatus Nitronereus thalassa]MDT7042619.1 DNA polymerase III subunit gamma/tau [Candidatus Nitronereus thalassa]